MPATCLVSARDYAIYWLYAPESRADYSGPDRRLALVDRRRPGHERRWDASRGRRFNVGDRRALGSRVDARGSVLATERRAVGRPRAQS